jgi:hypothetical protein
MPAMNAIEVSDRHRPALSGWRDVLDTPNHKTHG